MLVCPSCARLFTSGESVCPEDGVFLQKPTDPRTGIQVGNYLLKGCLGHGGMGHVYRAEHVVIRKEVAVKVLREAFASQEQIVQRFLMEARAASMIRHPNIVDVTDFGQLPDGCSFIVMEFLEGPNLAQEIARQDHLPLYRSVNILTQVARALHACHGKRIAHRDLKPENIVLLKRSGRRELVELPRRSRPDPVVRPERFFDQVKILDFGIAKIQEMTSALDDETLKRGVVFGSPYYLSPEQARGEPGDRRSDIYALGIILFEMLTGEVPFDGNKPMEIMAKHVEEPVPSMRIRRPDLELPPEADQLVVRAAAKNPDDRHRSAAAFLEELSNCFGDVIYGRDVDRYVKTRKRKRRDTMLRWQPPGGAPPTSSGEGRNLTPKQVQINSELKGLFDNAYEQPSPVTEPSLEGGDPQAERRGKTRPDSAAIRAELDGLFDREDD